MTKDFYAVGLGASAGGLNSMIKFFSCIPEDIGVSFIVVSHLLREHRSNLAEILAKKATLPVIRIDQDMKLVPGKIYVLIENTFITIKEGFIKMSLRDDNKINHSIDIFMKTLADDFQKKAVAIIFSGFGNDGMKGSEAIAQHGGYVMVEDPLSAEADGMPMAVIINDHPKAVMRPEELAEKLTSLCRAAG